MYSDRLLLIVSSDKIKGGEEGKGTMSCYVGTYACMHACMHGEGVGGRGRDFHTHRATVLNISFLSVELRWVGRWF